MNLLYDNLIYYLQNIGGISSYWYELSTRLLKKEDVSLQFYEGKSRTNSLLRDRLALSDQQLISRHGFASLIDRLSRLPAREDRYIFHSSYYRIPIKTPLTTVVTTVHDFTYEKYYSGARTFAHRYLKNKAIKASDQIIVISENTKNDLLNFHPQLKENTVKVIYHGASNDYQPLKNVQASLERPFFIFVGSREHYKNFDFVVRLTALCKEFDLYIVGSRPSKAETRLLNSSLGKRYRCFQQISNAALNALFNKAFCLIYPSSNEGFGIPLLEAMQAGCPFISLKASSIPEVAGNAGILLNELDLEEALIAVEQIKLNKASFVEGGFAQSKKFSWDKCFEETFDLYRTLS